MNQIVIKRRDVILAVCAAVFALLMSTLVAESGRGFSPDGASALNVAMNIASGRGVVKNKVRNDSPPEPTPAHAKPPLFRLAIAGLIKLGVTPRHAGWAIVTVAFAVSAALLYLFARLVLPLVTALVVTGLYAFHMHGLRWSVLIHEQWPFMALALGALFMATVLRSSPDARHWQWVLMGFIAGAAMLTSYQGFPLLFVIGLALTIDAIKDRNRIGQLALYVSGLFLVGAYPFWQFVMFRTARQKASIEALSTWHEVSAGFLSTLQNDFLGQLLIWFYGDSPVHIIALLLTFCFLASLVILVAFRHRPLVLPAAFAALFVPLLIWRLSVNGKLFEPRWALPVEGLILLFAVVVFWSWRAKSTGPRYFSINVVMIIGALIYLNGQFRQYERYAEDSGIAGFSREYCPSPRAIKWIRDNVPAGETIIASQCGFQLLAETVDYNWIPIPPANEGKATATYPPRWGEGDFIDVSCNTGATWIAFLNGINGDPLVTAPGYGAFTSKLANGLEVTERIRRMATFEDGNIYRILPGLEDCSHQ